MSYKRTAKFYYPLWMRILAFVYEKQQRNEKLTAFVVFRELDVSQSSADIIFRTLMQYGLMSKDKKGRTRTYELYPEAKKLSKRCSDIIRQTERLDL